MNKFIQIFIFFLVFSAIHSSAQNLIINEIVASSTNNPIDSYGDYSDWIEIHNPGNSIIDLEGYHLSDNPENPLKWSFPSVSIPSGGYLIVFASERNTIGNELHANFKIATEGEKISLFSPNGNLVDEIDSIPLRTNISYGRYIGGETGFRYFSTPTPGAENSTPYFMGFLTDAEISHPSGYYTQPISVTAQHSSNEAILHYTIDGSEPTDQSPIFPEDLDFNDASTQPNSISLIPTNPSFNYPMPGFDESRANSRGWLPPYNNVNKINVLKVKAFRDGLIPSEITTNTYLINPEAEERYSLPVISLTTDPDNFFDNETGIYVYGTVGELGNYSEAGDEWERPIHIQYFEKDGNIGFEQDFGVRIHGAGGRHSAIKNLRIYARSEYGDNKLEYKFFENDDNNDFKRFMIRGPGHTPGCGPRDDFADLLLQNQNMDIQHVQHVILFVNGEYWGIHAIKERFDQDYLELKYGKKDDDYVILRNSGVLDSGEEGDQIPYTNLLSFVTENNMTLPENYDYVKAQVDMDNYLSYYTSEVFFGNVDWIESNIKFWRYKGLDKNNRIANGLDGKWRWFMYDFDLVFGQSCDEINYTVNMLDNSIDPEYGNSTKLARGLMQNEQFVIDFTNRMCDHFNSNFNERNFIEKLTEIDETLTPEMLEHTNRWRYPSTAITLDERQYETPSLNKWNAIMADLYEYPTARKRKIIDHMKAQFGHTDTVAVVLNVNDKLMGNIKINSLFISENLDGVTENVFPWHGTYFKNVPIQVVAVPKLGFRFVNWLETGETTDTLNLTLAASDSYTAVFEEDPDFIFNHALFINEFMASNQTTITDEYQVYSDWIEIYNPNNFAVDLAGFFVSDDAEETFKYQFPRGSRSTIIEPMGYKLIWADDRPERGALHASFKLSATGEDLVLMAPDSSLIDYLSYGIQQEDVSFGREKDGEDAWKFFQLPVGPTPNATNNNASIDEYALELLRIYPNPVKQGMPVYLNQKANISIFNNLGQLVLQLNNVFVIDTQNLPQGMYYILTDDLKRGKLLIN